MATYIKTLKEDNGDITYPQTKAEGVLLNNGSDLETELSQFVTAEDIASTSALTPPVQPNMIADGYRLVGYAVDDVPSEDTPNAWAAKLGGDGVYVTELTASRFSAQPAAVGTLRTTITSHYNRMEQEFTQLSGGVKYYRCGNNTGWWGQSGGSGAFRKIIDNGQSATVTSNMIDWSTLAPYWKVVATSNTNTVTIPLNYKLYRIRLVGYKNNTYWGVIGCNQATGTTWTYIQGTSSGTWVQSERSINATNDKAIMDGARNGTPAGVQTWDIALSRTTLTEQNFVATWSTCTTGSNTYNTGRSIFTLTSGTGSFALWNDLTSSITWCVEALIES